MSGTFVTSCEDFNAFENGDPNKPVPCSSVAAERIGVCSDRSLPLAEGLEATAAAAAAVGAPLGGPLRCAACAMAAL